MLFSVLLVYSMKITFNSTVRLLLSLARQGRSPKGKTWRSLGVQTKAFNFFTSWALQSYRFGKTNGDFVLTILSLLISVTFSLAATYNPAWYHRQSKYLPSKVLCPLGCVHPLHAATLQSWGTSFTLMLQGLLWSLERWMLYLWPSLSLNGDQELIIMAFQT